MSKNNKNDNMNTPKKHLMLSAARHRNQKKNKRIKSHCTNNLPNIDEEK